MARAAVRPQANLDDASARYGKPVLVAETACAHTLVNDGDLENNVARADQLMSRYPATPAGQAANPRDVTPSSPPPHHTTRPTGAGEGAAQRCPACPARPGAPASLDCA
ncbi:glycosyl hydrolase 53 family protein [Streptomyces hypolithicus]